MSLKLITIYVDGTQLTVKKLNLNDTLVKIRQKIADKNIRIKFIYFRKQR